MLRRLTIIAALAAAPLAAAQPYAALRDGRDAENAAAAEAARQRDIALTNELSRLQTQAQTTQNLSDLSALRAGLPAPVVRFDPKAPPPKLDPSQFAQIPDAALADSDAKVRAASQNKR